MKKLSILIQKLTFGRVSEVVDQEITEQLITVAFCVGVITASITAIILFISIF